MRRAPRIRRPLATTPHLLVHTNLEPEKLIIPPRLLNSIFRFVILARSATEQQLNDKARFVPPPPQQQHLCSARRPPPPLLGVSAMSGTDAPVDEERALRDAMSAVESASQALGAKRKRSEESLEEQKREFAAEVKKVRADAAEAAAKVKVDAETEAAEILRVAAVERAALDAEKAAMEKTYAFQTSQIKLDVGGHKFTTSLPTLTSVPDTYLEAFFSGRHPLALSAEGAFFIDRDGAHFRHVINYMRDPGRDE